MGVYLDAARMVHDGEALGCCRAIHVASGLRSGRSQASVYFELLFHPYYPPPYPFEYTPWWGDLWGDSEQECRECRVLALCLMAAMMGEEDAAVR